VSSRLLVSASGQVPASGPGASRPPRWRPSWRRWGVEHRARRSLLASPTSRRDAGPALDDDRLGQRPRGIEHVVRSGRPIRRPLKAGTTNANDQLDDAFGFVVGRSWLLPLWRPPAGVIAKRQSPTAAGMSAVTFSPGLRGWGCPPRNSPPWLIRNSSPWAVCLPAVAANRRSHHPGK
jgi:hypothetical protein